MRIIQYVFDGQECRVTLGAGALAVAGETISRARRGGEALLVTDSNVGPLYGAQVADALRGAGVDCHLHVIPAGEESKSIEQAQVLYDRLAAMRLARDGFLVAVGGGVVSDLTGFVAATWLRGVDFVICPTSLEAAVDACIGGKTAVNHRAGKNLIGVFHQPVEVVMDPVCLKTLPHRDLIAGLAESLKHALIADPAFVAWHESHREAILTCDPATMEELLARNVAIKAGVVTQDPRERSGERARLNFGHSIGHAIEASSGWVLRHGECVALGMVGAARISAALGLLREEECARVERLVESFGLPVRYARLAPHEALTSYLASDKKVAAARVRWVLLSAIGTTVIGQEVEENIVRWAVDSLR